MHPTAATALAAAAPTLFRLGARLAERRVERAIRRMGEKPGNPATVRMAIHELAEAADRATPWTGLGEAVSDAAIDAGEEVLEVLYEMARERHPELPELDEPLREEARKGLRASRRRRLPIRRWGPPAGERD